jgi:hypothetical protein
MISIFVFVLHLIAASNVQLNMEDCGKPVCERILEASILSCSIPRVKEVIRFLDNLPPDPGEHWIPAKDSRQIGIATRGGDMSVWATLANNVKLVQLREWYCPLCRGCHRHYYKDTAASEFDSEREEEYFNICESDGDGDSYGADDENDKA